MIGETDSEGFKDEFAVTLHRVRTIGFVVFGVFVGAAYLILWWARMINELAS